jgi:hypothetical protein
VARAQLLVLVVVLVLGGSRARAEEHEAYEEVMPAIADVGAIAHPELPWHAAWQRLHEVNLQFTAMLLGFYGDRELALKLRNMEPQLWAAQLQQRSLGGALKRRLVLHGLNISHSGTLADPNLPGYLHQLGISKEGLAAGRRFLFVDGTYWQGDTYHTFVKAAFGEEHIGKQPFRVTSDSGGNQVPHSWVALNVLRPNLLGGVHDQAGFDTELNVARSQAATDWEFSRIIPHFTGNSDHYAMRNGQWKAMARKDRKVWSGDQPPLPLDEERARGLAFMEDLKAYFTKAETRTRMAKQIKMWRTLRAKIDRGDAHGLADLLTTLHAEDAAHAEAVGRDLIGMLRSGHAGRGAPMIPDSVGHLHQASPILPKLIAHLRGFPKR